MLERRFGSGACGAAFTLDVTNDAIAHWHFTLGLWTVCSRNTTLEQLSGAFRSSSAESRSWIESRGIEVLVDRFHDEASWVLALSTERNAA